MLGDTDSILGSVPQNAQIVNQEQAAKAGQAEKVADTAMAPSQAAGKEKAVLEAQKQVNQITITPQMAKGLKDVTGQSWDQAVGTKWDPKVFVPMTTLMSKNKYRQDILEGKVDIEKMKEQSKKDLSDQADKSKKDIEDLKSKHTKELEDLKAKHRFELKGGPGGRGGTDPETQGRQLLDAINKANKGGDDAVKKSAVDNYNSFAKEHNLSPYAEGEGLMSQLVGGLKKAFGGKGGGGQDKQKATDWLKKNHPELKNPTDDDIEWAQGKMK